MPWEEIIDGAEAANEPSRFTSQIGFEWTSARGGCPGDGAKIRAWQTSTSGLAAVWARDYTREAIFDVMERKEV